MRITLLLCKNSNDNLFLYSQQFSDTTTKEKKKNSPEMDDLTMYINILESMNGSTYLI